MIDESNYYHEFVHKFYLVCGRTVCIVCSKGDVYKTSKGELCYSGRIVVQGAFSGYEFTGEFAVIPEEKVCMHSTSRQLVKKRKKAVEKMQCDEATEDLQESKSSKDLNLL